MFRRSLAGSPQNEILRRPSAEGRRRIFRPPARHCQRWMCSPPCLYIRGATPRITGEYSPRWRGFASKVIINDGRPDGMGLHVCLPLSPRAQRGVSLFRRSLAGSPQNEILRRPSAEGLLRMTVLRQGLVERKPQPCRRSAAGDDLLVQGVRSEPGVFGQHAGQPHGLETVFQTDHAVHQVGGGALVFQLGHDLAYDVSHRQQGAGRIDDNLEAEPLQFILGNYSPSDPPRRRPLWTSR